MASFQSDPLPEGSGSFRPNGAAADSTVREGFWSRLNTYENRLLVVLSLGGGVAALDAQALFYISPFVAKDLALNNAQIGLLSSAVLVTWSIAAYLVGALSDRTGRRKPFLVLGFSLFAMFSSLSGLAVNFATLLVARLTVGVSEGPVIPLSNSIMAANSTPSRRGFNLGMVQNFGAQLFGTFFGPMVLVALAVAFNWRVAFFIAGVPGLLTALLIFWVVKEPRIAARSSPPEERGLKGLVAVLAIRNVWLSAAIAVCMVGWYLLLLTFLPLYCINYLHISPSLMSFILAAVGAAGAVSAVGAPALSDRIGRKPVMIALGLLGAVAPAAALLLSPGLGMIAMVFVGSFALGIFPLFMGAVPQESVPSSKAAQSSGIVMAFGQIIGGFCGPSLAGIAADAFSLRAPLEISAVLAVLGGIVALFLRETAPCRTGAA